MRATTIVVTDCVPVKRHTSASTGESAPTNGTSLEVPRDAAYAASRPLNLEQRDDKGVHDYSDECKRKFADTLASGSRAHRCVKSFAYRGGSLTFNIWPPLVR